MVKGYKTFVQSLADGQQYDHLRLPLQASALLTPILLLAGISIHQSQNYCQRYRVMLVCALFCCFLTILYSYMASQYARSLGTARPKSVVALESVIWKAIFNIARGEMDVYAAAQVIADAIPAILETTAPEDKLWFLLGSLLIPLLILLSITHLSSESF